MLFNEISKIIKNKELLEISYVPKTIVGRDKEIEELAFHLSYIFRENPSLPQQIIFGSVGTGKTTVVLYVLKELEKESKKKNINLKIVRVKGSESRTKYEILRKVLGQIASDLPIPNTSAELHSKITHVIAERGLYVLIFIDEIHELRDVDLNSTLYTISRLGQDVAFTDVHKKSTLNKIIKGNVGYILVSNDANIHSKLKENTRSSLTKENLIFKRYTPGDIINILKSRIKEGSLYKNVVGSGVLELIAAESVKEGQDARYALLLLSNSAKEAEKKGYEAIDINLVRAVNKVLLENNLMQFIRELSELHLEVLTIIYNLNLDVGKINSKTIYEFYKKIPQLPNRDFSRISQIVTDLEKDNIIYVTSSKKTKLRELSINENLKEIKEVLKEKGKI